MRGFISLRRRGQRGAAAVEFAIVLPLVMLVLLGCIEFAMIAHHKLALAQAARAGVREASIGRPLAVIKSKIKAATGPDITLTDDDIVVENNSEDDGSGFWQFTGDTNDGSANAGPYGRLMRVRVAWSHPLITGSFFSFLPGVQQNQLPMRGQAIMRRE
jgi:Flp pilus assembly protein TadG